MYFCHSYFVNYLNSIYLFQLFDLILIVSSRVSSGSHLSFFCIQNISFRVHSPSTFPPPSPHSFLTQFVPPEPNPTEPSRMMLKASPALSNKPSPTSTWPLAPPPPPLPPLLISLLGEGSVYFGWKVRRKKLGEINVFF